MSDLPKVATESDIKDRVDKIDARVIDLELMSKRLSNLEYLEGKYDFLEKGFRILEKENKSLRALVGAPTTGAPIQLGETYFPNGDAIPTHGSPAEHFEGRVYNFGGKPCRFTKNIGGCELEPGKGYCRKVGDATIDGVVDGKLSLAVSPNNFFWLEL